MKILVSGSSGLIGSAAVHHLTKQGHQVSALVRDPRKAKPGDVPWSPQRPLAPDALSPFDAVIHLAGKTVAGRWTEKSKAEIRESRARGTRVIAEAVAQAFRSGGCPRVLVSASAIGYYGSRGDEMLTEESRAGNGFLAETGREWESATGAAGHAGVRVVMPRIGLVLSTRGGALAKMLPAFRMGVAGRIGSGHQYWSWITLDDLVRVMEFALVDERVSGAVNAVAPEATTNAEFTKVLASVLHRPALFPLPAYVARLAFGAMADELLLSSQRVEPAKLNALGFKFQDADLRSALERVLR